MAPSLAPPDVLFNAKFTVLYQLLLVPSQSPSGWQKAKDHDGPVTLMQKGQEFHLSIRPLKQGVKEWVQVVNSKWELDPQPNYMFFKIADQADPGQGSIYGLWFQDDQERQDLQMQLERCVRSSKADEESPIQQPPGPPPLPQQQPQPQHAYPKQSQPPQYHHQPARAPPEQTAQPGPKGYPQHQMDNVQVTVTVQQVREAIRGLADNDQFIFAIMENLRMVAAQGATQ